VGPPSEREAKRRLSPDKMVKRGPDCEGLTEAARYSRDQARTICRTARCLGSGDRPRRPPKLPIAETDLRHHLALGHGRPSRLRAKETSELRWSMVTDAPGQITDVLFLQNKAKRGGREVPLPLCGDL